MQLTPHLHENSQQGLGVHSQFQHVRVIVSTSALQEVVYFTRMIIFIISDMILEAFCDLLANLDLFPQHYR